MRIELRKTVLASLALLAGAALSPAVAQDYPAKPVKMVVPYAAGGLPDVVTRTVGQRLSEALGQQFVVENKPGAGGIAATQSVVQAAPDGYTLLAVDAGPITMNPFLFSKLPYDTVKDLTPVSLLAISPLYIVSSPTSKIGSFAEFISFARANPGRLNYGSSGIGSIHHISMESIKSSLGLDIVHVPYKGTGQSVPAFIGGEVQIIVSALPSIGSYVKSGQATLLAASSLERYPDTPDVPAVSEFIPGYDFPAEVGILAPAGTPAAIVGRLAAEIGKALTQADTQARLQALGAQGVGLSPAAYAEHIRRGLEKYAVAVKVSGAKSD
jgi:tripartite-type tricarboxylate transporter receptor subunit TctC